jgi:cyanate lyase
MSPPVVPRLPVLEPVQEEVQIRYSLLYAAVHNSFGDGEFSRMVMIEEHSKIKWIIEAIKSRHLSAVCTL